MNSDYSVPIVQGTAVPAPDSRPYDGAHAKSHYGAPTDNFQNEGTTINFDSHFQQQQQPTQFRDVFWAFAFVAHIGVMSVLISMNIAANGGGGDNGDGFSGSYGGIFFLVAATGLAALGLSSLTIVLMMKFPTAMVKAGLVFSSLLAGVMAVAMILSGEMFAILMGVFFFAVTACYVVAVWKRIPYAAANLNTALTAVKSNAGLSLVAYSVMFVAFAWSGFWLAGMANSLATSNGGTVFLLLVSFYWTFGVLTNTIHVTTAGTVGTWWFVPGEASGCCSKGLQDSFCRATSYSFGSICLGSLLVAVVQALRQMARNARQNEDAQLLACLIECILSCIQDIIEYFNKWAYIYVGLYGFGYIEAGRNVVELFRSKGWTTVITDDLADRVLLMMSIGVGVLTGLVGLLVGSVYPGLLEDFGVEDGGGVTTVAFVVGFFVGLGFCSILMSVVGSAVNTVIVCFAESPAEFEANHPVLSRELRSAWVEAWPELSIQ